MYEDILEALNHLNLRKWFVENDPPPKTSYAFWEAPEMDLVYTYINPKYSCIEFSVRCVDAKKYLKSIRL